MFRWHGVISSSGEVVSGFRGAALNQSRSASGVYTGLICYGGVTLNESASCNRGKCSYRSYGRKWGLR
ncbi:TPA: hypothetical protein MIH98_27890 [Klebsiella pneumoniae]|nr:hypothetical protein [Klebsiella pneumoniae]